MAEEISALIAKIQKEGVQAAEDMARQIREKALLEATEIIKKAKKEAEGIILAAQKEAEQIKKITAGNLKQSGRDFILSLRKEITRVLNKVILVSVQDTLSAEQLAAMISGVINSYSSKSDTSVEVILNKDDLKKLKEAFLSKLIAETKKEIVLKPSEDILKGFNISFNSSKFQFDFTDQALAAYVADYLKPELKEILESE
ncbi:MAG: hypothetical protein ABIG46_00555 [Candidatus Omnitrophota bacterium]